MPTVIDIDQFPSMEERHYAVAWLDSPMPHYGKFVLVGNYVLETELFHFRFSDPDDILKRPFIGLGWDKVDIPLDELFAEDVIPVPVKRPSGRRDISSLFGMIDPQVESVLGRERYEDDDGEWANVSSQIVRSMTPAREKIWRAESEMWLNTRFGHRLSKEDFEAIFEIRGLEPNEWTGKFVEDLLPVKSKWRRW